jgi:pimeloyl-ACP methyl ester carboxylesterase
MLVVYLHGFASSAGSSKAAYLGERLRACGVDFQAPDLNLPDFTTLTVTRMLEQTGALIDRVSAPITLVGSSLGGFVAVNAAVKWPDRVSRLVLMAPALDFSDSGLRGPGGADVAEWKRTGSLNVFHFAYGRMMPIHYALYDDARRYDAMRARIDMPVMVFQGRRDTAVDPVTVEQWSRARPNVELHMLDDGHQLTASIEYIWEEMKRFLNLTASTPNDPTPNSQVPSRPDRTKG